ncbi:hypothetical protein PTTG_03862 [Puccinia triticina 1-1 BBBD Race 1]|uniref:Chloride channel protein n=1 Tax=Puccinia triticina (isolate 1-1 / race 1 (BBBD)) TaxID=630390 RepID=A0A180GRH9_PUCT1|nr:hypothetical protein PTTG_03862 [Puccinia triticina 1-1 BBBD Race 1]
MDTHQGSSTQSRRGTQSSRSGSPVSSISYTPPVRSPTKNQGSRIFGPFLKKDPLRGLSSPISLRLLGSSTALDAGEGSTREQYGEDGQWWRGQRDRRPAEGQRVERSYADRTMIDWAYEDRKERSRLQRLDQLPGLRGILARLVNLTWPWIGVVLVGAIVGLVAGSLDTLALWLSDLRDGKCDYAFYLNKNACCSGLEPHEICYEWKTWPQVFQISSAPIASFSHYLAYIISSVTFAGVVAFLVKAFAPFAFHTGIPEIKVILSGYTFQHYLSAWTLLIKAIGLAFAVGSGLSLGKEGPLVHVACCVANLVLHNFKVFRTNEARKREMLSAAAASGVSVAFGAPLGGVLFVLEELSLASLPQPTLWRSFVCAIVATMTLQSFDPFNSGKLVLFQVQSVGQVWRTFELIPWVFVGVCGGLFGATFIRANIECAKIRRSSGLADHPIKEVLAVAGFTALVSYLLLITRLPTSKLVEALFQECSASNLDVFSFCDPSQVFSTVVLLLIAAVAKAVVTSITFGIQVPSGIFLPAISIGACFGRAIGMIIHSWQQAYPRFWLFGSCPAEGTCISPQVYAVIGAASAVGGLTRMTVSLVVIIFELTGAVELVLQIMMAVMISKFTADYFSTDGIYEAWIHFRAYPYLSPKEDFQPDGVTASQVMVKELVSLSGQGWTVDSLEEVVRKYEFNGFPIVSDHKNNLLLGYVPSNELRFALAQARMRPECNGSTRCEFFTSRPASHEHQLAKSRQGEKSPASSGRQNSHQDLSKTCLSTRKLNSASRSTFDRLSDEDDELNGRSSGFIDLNKWVDEAPLTLEPETPIEIVLQFFQRLGLRNMLFTSHGSLAGILTIKDLHKYIRAPYYSSLDRARKDVD